MEINKESFEEAFKRANEGDSSIQFDLAEYYKSIEDYFNALTWYIKSAEQGNEKALSVLFTPVEIEDKCNVIEIKPFYVQKAEEEEKRKATIATIIDTIIGCKRAEIHIAEEARRLEEEKARQKAEEEARLKADEEARLKADEEARRKAEEEARRKAAEEEARRKAEEEARRKAAEEEARRKAEEEARRKAEEEARRKAEEEARRKAAEETRRKAEEEARHRSEIEIKANNLKKNYPEIINSILDDMILVEGKSYHRFTDVGTSNMTSVEDFWVKKNTITRSEFFPHLGNDSRVFDNTHRNDAIEFAEVLSCATSFKFTLPSAEQLEYVLRGGKNCDDNSFLYNNSIIPNLNPDRSYHEMTKSSVLNVSPIIEEKPIGSYESRISTYTCFRLVSTDPTFFEYKKKQQEEAKRKAEEEARRKAEEVKQEAQLLAQERTRLAPLLEGLNNEMLLVESGDIPVKEVIIQGNSPHTVKTEEFCILYSTINVKAVEFILGRELKTDKFGAFGKEIAEELCEKLSNISGKEFSLPSVNELEAAYNSHLWSIRASLCCYEWCKDKNDVRRTLISTKLNRPAPAVACFRFVTKDSEVIASIKKINSWENVIKVFIAQRETYEYKHGIFFGDKRDITIVKQPLTYRVWKAVIKHDTKRDKKSDRLIAKKDLGDFLNVLNKSGISDGQFDYLHNNPYAYGALSARKVVDENGVYLYIKD